MECCQRLWAPVNNCRCFLISRSYLDGAYRKAFLLCKSGMRLSSKMDGPRRGTLRGVIEKRRTLGFVLTPLHPCPHCPVFQFSVIGLPRLLCVFPSNSPRWSLAPPTRTYSFMCRASSCPHLSAKKDFVIGGWAAPYLNYLERCISGCCRSRWLPVFKLPVSSLLACCTLQRLSNSPTKSMNPKLTRPLAASP